MKVGGARAIKSLNSLRKSQTSHVIYSSHVRHVLALNLPEIKSCVHSGGIIACETTEMSSTGDDDELDLAQGEHASSADEYGHEPKGESQDEDYEASEDSDREGRFHGPDSSWRFYTKEDRAIVASLDQAENNDLSIHLYNTHAWKQRLRDVERMKNCLPWQSKLRWIQREDDGKMPFLPPTAWTAWPMRPEDVPRSREQWGILLATPEDDNETFCKREPWRPSLQLQEELKAAFLRKAKEGFEERERNAENDVASKSAQDLSSESSSRRSESAGTEDGDESDRDRKPQHNVKQEHDSGNEDVEIVSEFEDGTNDFIPSVLLDDDLASTILQPTIHHLTAKFDQLLVGLHNSRLGHHQDRSRSRARSTDSPLRPKSRERARSVAGVPSKRKRAASNLKLEDDEFQPGSDSDESESNVQMRGRRSTSRGSRKRMLGPRDWSEVLGIAALAGWDRDIVDRAARRCAALFGESMALRIMPETSFGNSRDEVVEYVPQMIPRVYSTSEDEDDSQEELEQEAGFACPEKSCARHNDPYDTRWRLREHLKKKHGLSVAEIAELVPQPKAQAQNPNSTSNDDDEHGDIKNFANTAGNLGDAVRVDGYLQPIDLRLHRSKDKQPRRSSSSRRRDTKAGDMTI